MKNTIYIYADNYDTHTFFRTLLSEKCDTEKRKRIGIHCIDKFIVDYEVRYAHMEFTKRSMNIKNQVIKSFSTY